VSGISLGIAYATRSHQDLSWLEWIFGRSLNDGHRTIQMTMRYAHLAPAHKLAAVERLAGMWQVNEATDTKTDTSNADQAPLPVLVTH